MQGVETLERDPRNPQAAMRAFVERRSKALGGTPLAWRIAVGDAALEFDLDGPLAAEVRRMDDLVLRASGPRACSLAALSAGLGA